MNGPPSVLVDIEYTMTCCAKSLPALVHVAPFDAISADAHESHLIEAQVVGTGVEYETHQRWDCVQDRDAAASNCLNYARKANTERRQDTEAGAIEQGGIDRAP